MNETLIQKMRARIAQNNLVGLAASQMGDSETPVYDKIIIALNKVYYEPEITKYSEKTDVDIEGCDSYPGEFYRVERPKMIELEWIDGNGRLKKKVFKGLQARVIQHEVDHLTGVSPEKPYGITIRERRLCND